jgi:hypothetical protein
LPGGSMKKKHTLRRAPSSCVRENLFMTSFLHRDTSVTNFCCSQGQWLASQFVSAIRKIVLNSSECFPNDSVLCCQLQDMLDHRWGASSPALTCKNSLWRQTWGSAWCVTGQSQFIPPGKLSSHQTQQNLRDRNKPPWWLHFTGATMKSIVAIILCHKCAVTEVDIWELCCCWLLYSVCGNFSYQNFGTTYWSRL